MNTESKFLTLSIDGLWAPMDFARLIHLVVRSYRLEQLAFSPQTGGPNFFDRRLDPVVLKYVAAFDWIAAPLMSGKYNDSYAKSEDFVRDFGVADLRIRKIGYGSPGCIEFAGIGTIIDKLFDAFHQVLLLKQSSPVSASDAIASPAKLVSSHIGSSRSWVASPRVICSSASSINSHAAAAPKAAITNAHSRSSSIPSPLGR